MGKLKRTGTNILESVSEGGKYRLAFVLTLFIIGIIIGVSITDFSDKVNMATAYILSDNSSTLATGAFTIPIYRQAIFFVTAFLLGVPCVISLGERLPVLGNTLGLASNVGEIFINALFGNYGLALAGIYYGLTHILGLFVQTRDTAKDENGRVIINKMNPIWVVFTIISLIGGLILLVFYGGALGFATDGTLIGDVIYWGNIIAYVLGVVSQFLMIMRIDFSWWGWFASNFFWFTLDLASGNLWFAFRDLLYQTNAVTSIYGWYKNSKLQKEKVTK
ncbi:nicotinamide mononucleotide transporter [Enterococcus phage phiSHEF16]|uniref:Nicotinamide mononucleotide transporter n=1 Tax=Enterococcus phage phiSHEF16 TaxID=2918650 RepID=A0AAE9FKS9_9CAUD|nr:nicotinamide mononucleotide transporter [Enterococcus phage phiSHEF16]